MIHTEQHMILSLAATIYCPGVLLKPWFPQTLVFKNSLTPSNTSKIYQNKFIQRVTLPWSLASLQRCPSFPVKYSKQIAIFNSIAFLLWPSHKRLRKWKKNFVFFVRKNIDVIKVVFHFFLTLIKISIYLLKLTEKKFPDFSLTLRNFLFP